MLRTHTCGELRKEDINKEVILCGWVSVRRDHGKLIFIDLRDRYGLTQVVFLPKSKDTHEVAKRLRNEDVIKLKGTVNLRPRNTENSNIPTGLVEICAQDLEILSAAQDLPFSIEDVTMVGEETRFTHRYLDLRRKTVVEKIILRHRLNQAFREFFNKKGFLEIETPILTKSTPEGARDYLVPSRLNPAKFYALPQSPQLFKQILMVGGLDKYYQIVRCFRDEDLRKDRQPEFTQLDIELSFVEEEDIFFLIENMMFEVFKKELNIELKIPFPRIPHKEAIAKHGTDKPDLRQDKNSGEFCFLWVVDFPLFERDNLGNRWKSCHHPFTGIKEEDLSSLDSDPSEVRSRSYDLVLNGEEMGSGSIRIHSSSLQTKIFNILGISEEQAQKKFGFLLRAFQYGVPPHGGIAFGLDRLYAIISGSESIREVIAFPKTQRGICPLSEAPSSVDADQLDELYIEVKEQKKNLDS